jgi:putative DNA methylase
VEKVVRSGIGVSQAAKFNLLGIDGTESKWDPRADKTLTVWEATHNLIARLGDSEIHAANLYSLLGPGFADQAKQLAYLLYSVAVGKSRDKDAFNYNMLVTAWPEIEKLARQTSSIDSTTETLF